MVDIKKLQSLLFEDEPEEDEEVNFTSEQPLAHENTTQITIDPAVFAEPEEEPEETEEPDFPEEPVFDDEENEEYEEASEEEVVIEEEAAEEPSLFDELTGEAAAEEEPAAEPVEEDLPEEHEEAPLVEELPVFEEIIDDEPVKEPSIEEKIDAIVFGDNDGFSDIDDLFAEFAAAADLDAVEEPQPEETPEEVLFPSDPVAEEEPEEEQQEILEDIPEAEAEDVPEENGETTNIVDFFSDIAGEDIPETVANEKTAPLDLDAILGASAQAADTEEAAEPVEEAPVEEEVDFFEEKLTIEEEPVKPAKKDTKKEFVYHFQPIISPLFGTDLSESQTTKKAGEDRQIIVTSNLDVHDDAPTEILDTRSLKDDEE